MPYPSPPLDGEKSVDSRGRPIRGVIRSGVAVWELEQPPKYEHPDHTGDVESFGDGPTFISNGAVTTPKLHDSAVSEAKLRDAGVTSRKLARDAVIASKIENEAVTLNKIQQITGPGVLGNLVAGPGVVMPLTKLQMLEFLSPRVITVRNDANAQTPGQHEFNGSPWELIVYQANSFEPQEIILPAGLSFSDGSSSARLSATHDTVTMMLDDNQVVHILSVSPVARYRDVNLAGTLLFAPPAGQIVHVVARAGSSGALPGSVATVSFLPGETLPDGSADLTFSSEGETATLMRDGAGHVFKLSSS